MRKADILKKQGHASAEYCQSVQMYEFGWRRCAETSFPKKS